MTDMANKLIRRLVLPLVLVAAIALPGPASAAEGTLHAVLIGVNDYGGDFKMKPDNGGNVEHAVPRVIEGLVALHNRMKFEDLLIRVYADLTDGQKLTPDWIQKKFAVEDWAKRYGRYVHAWHEPYGNTVQGVIERMFDSNPKLDNGYPASFKKGDTLLLYFTGHGTMKGDELRLNMKHSGNPAHDPREASLPGRPNTYITMQNHVIGLLKDYLKIPDQNLKPERIILLFDNCSNNPDDVRNMPDPNYNPEYLESLNNLDLGTPGKVFVYMATHPEKFAHINKQEQMGQFTEAIVQTLKGQIPLDKIYDNITTGKIHTNELINYVNYKVRRDTKRKQVPKEYVNFKLDRPFFERRVQDVYLYMIPPDWAENYESITTEIKSVWDPSAIAADWKRRKEFTSPNLPFEAGGDWAETHNLIRQLTEELFACFNDDYVSYRSFSCDRKPSENDSAYLNRKAAAIVDQHKVRFENIRKDDKGYRARVLVVALTEPRKDKIILRAALIDREKFKNSDRRDSETGADERPEIKAITVDPIEIEIPITPAAFKAQDKNKQTEIYEEWAPKMFVAQKTLFDTNIKNFYPAFQTKRLMVSCFIFTNVTQAMLSEPLNSNQNSDDKFWTREFYSFPKHFAGQLKRSGLDTNGFDVATLTENDIKNSGCSLRVLQEPVETLDEVIQLSDSVGTRPFPVGRRPGHFDVIVGGYLGPHKDKNAQDPTKKNPSIIFAIPQLGNTQLGNKRWGEITGDPEYPTVPGEMGQYKVLRDHIITILTDKLSGHHADLRENF